MDSDELKNEIGEELSRLLATPEFSNAHRSAALLRFLVTESLEGRAKQLKEYVVGLRALGRPGSFDPRIDPIVRVEASRLRNKLELCYAKWGHSSGSLRIVLPRGTYAPEFVPIVKDASLKENETLASPKPGHPNFGWLVLSSATLTAFAIGVGLTYLGIQRPQVSQVLRLSLIPPRNSVVDSVATSPDGTRVVIAASIRGSSRLYLRSLADSFEPVPMPGTEDASFPFWSRDGRSVAFFARRKLKVLQLNEGGPRILADAPLGRGGAWSDTGEIVFAPGALGPLQTVNATGGTPKPFTALDTVHGEVSHLWPTVLPDGSRLAFLCQNRDPNLDSIVAVDLASPGKRNRVIHANSSFSLASASGALRIYFLRDGALLAQRLSRDLQPQGDPATLAQQVDFHPLDRYALFSSSTHSMLVFVPGTPFRYQLTTLDRTGIETGRWGELSDYYGLKLSPDGSHLLANRTEPSTGSTGVWSVDLRRGTTFPVTSGSVDFLPIWSPDGLQVAFARSDGTAERGMRLSTISANGGTPKVLLDVNGPVFPSDWSANGAYLAYTSYKPLAQLAVVSITGVPLTQFWSYAPPHHSAGGAVFEPGRPNRSPTWIAYTSDESDRNEVYVQSFPDSKHKLQISGSGGDSPLWRGDGKELFFLNAEEDLMAVDVSHGGGDHFGIPRRLFHVGAAPPSAPPYNLNYAVSSDGQRFYVRVVDPKSEPLILNILENLQF